MSLAFSSPLSRRRFSVKYSHHTYYLNITVSLSKSCHGQKNKQATFLLPLFGREKLLVLQ